MKRFTAGLVAVATALSLSAGAASAAEGVTSSTISDSQLNQWAQKQAQSDKPFASGFGSAVATSEDNPLNNEVLLSSLKNDAANDYKIGTTFTILWATGLTLSILGIAVGAAQQQGLLPK